MSSFVNFKFTKLTQPINAKITEDILYLISKGKQVVVKNLQQRLKNIHSAILIYNSKNQPIAITAIKKANPKYRDKIFAKAGIKNSQNFNYESGYSYVTPEYRQQGIYKKMKQLLFSNFNGNIYATTREDNLVVIESLKKFGFEVVGQPFKSNRGKYNLVLLIRK